MQGKWALYILTPNKTVDKQTARVRCSCNSVVAEVCHTSICGPSTPSRKSAESGSVLWQTLTLYSSCRVLTPTPPTSFCCSSAPHCLYIMSFSLSSSTIQLSQSSSSILLRIPTNLSHYTPQSTVRRFPLRHSSISIMVQGPLPPRFIFTSFQMFISYHNIHALITFSGFEYLLNSEGEKRNYSCLLTRLK